MENSANIMRLALIVSIIAHVLLMVFSDLCFGRVGLNLR